MKLTSIKTNDNENYIIMIEKENRSRITTNIYSNKNESEIFANSFQSESKTSMFDNEEEFNAIANEDENLNQRYMMTKALSTKNNSSEQMMFNIHVIALEHNASSERFSFLISRIFSSSQELIAKLNINSSCREHCNFVREELRKCREMNEF